MTEEQKELVCRIKLSLIGAIIDIKEQTIWDCIEKALKKEEDGGVKDEVSD